MSVRVNISIPDTLNERLAGYKDRLNVSAVCQEALEVQIAMLIAIDGVESQSDKIHAKWSAQMAMAKNEWYQLGLRDSAHHLEDLDYEDALAVSEADEKGTLSDIEWVDRAIFDSECPSSLQEHYRDGLVKGILDFLDSFHQMEY